MNEPTKLTATQRKELIEAIADEALDGINIFEQLEHLQEFARKELMNKTDIELIDLARRNEVTITMGDDSEFPPEDMMIVNPQLTMPVCPDCGSHNVSLDALVSWNVKAQEWEANGTIYDHGFCHECETAEIHPKFVPVTECDCKGMQATCEQCGGSGFKPVEVQS